MAIIATPGDPAANSYGTIAEANAFFLNRPNSDAWDNASDAEQESALIWATIRLDEYDYVGDIATDTQALKWPRIDNDVFDIVWDSTEIPPRLKYAEFELAIAGLSTGAVSTGGTSPISSLKIGSTVEVKYDTSSGAAIVDTSIDWTGLPIQVARFLRGLRLPAVLA